jgi:hypothetical protein
MKFEDQIKNMRSQMDVEQTDEQYIWKGIAKDIHKSKANRKLIFWKIAAGLLLILTTSLLIINYSNQNKNNSQLLLAEQDEEMAAQEAQLVKQINVYKSELKQANYNKEKLATEFSEIKKIDRLIQKYSEDLENYGPDPRILNTLMDLYHKKIMVMDRMLNEIQKTQKDENTKINI